MSESTNIQLDELIRQQGTIDEAMDKHLRAICAKYFLQVLKNPTKDNIDKRDKIIDEIRSMYNKYGRTDEFFDVFLLSLLELDENDKQ